MSSKPSTRYLGNSYRQSEPDWASSDEDGEEPDEEYPPLPAESTLDKLWGHIVLRVRENPAILDDDTVADAWRSAADAMTELAKTINLLYAVDDVQRAKADLAKAEETLARLQGR